MVSMNRFWDWYERNYLLNISIALSLFLLQIIHLIWLAVDVVALKVLGTPLLQVEGFLERLLIFVDFTEIPALISVSVVTIYDLRSRWSTKAILYLIFLNIQWLHLFWITDEFVVDAFASPISTTVYLAIIAIAIDYLEVPVMLDTIKKFVAAVRGRRTIEFFKKNFRK